MSASPALPPLLPLPPFTLAMEDLSLRDEELL
eukprot:CAMPEP_0197450608 /NCGR_PEP_ID=MMETSP1175-20131217/25883_1 /TAXON_ID=1003142 /ORGANISM="Triceratium dubium, Strain CCMP147" /LENGTH=31 /DNA_ID= /DNA_START= /DNA_END= /DNA_ORIENTATION=